MTPRFGFYLLTDPALIEEERARIVSDEHEEPIHHISNVRLQTGQHADGEPVLYVLDPEGRMWLFRADDGKSAVVDFDHGLPLGTED